MATRVEIVGLPRLRRSMRAAGVGLGELKDVNRAAAEVVAPYARVRAPRGPDAGGHVARTVRVGATAKAGVVRVGGKAHPYAGVVHWGWPKRKIKAQPWVTTAAAATESKWVGLYMRKLEALLDRIEGA